MLTESQKTFYNKTYAVVTSPLIMSILVQKLNTSVHSAFMHINHYIDKSPSSNLPVTQVSLLTTSCHCQHVVMPVDQITTSFASVTDIRSHKNISPRTMSGVGLLQISAKWCIWQPCLESSVSTERCCSCMQPDGTSTSLPCYIGMHWLSTACIHACLVNQSFSRPISLYLATDVQLVSNASHRHPLYSASNSSCLVPCTYNRNCCTQTAAPKCWTQVLGGSPSNLFDLSASRKQENH